MDVVNDDAKGSFRRIEVLTGPARRRRWSPEEKGRIVAETRQPGATVTEVARRWQVCPQQVWGWRREAREGALALPEKGGCEAAEANFLPIVTEAPAVVAAARSNDASTEHAARLAPPPSLEIRLAGAVIRVANGTDFRLLADVLRALRKSAA